MTNMVAPYIELVPYDKRLYHLQSPTPVPFVQPLPTLIAHSLPFLPPSAAPAPLTPTQYILDIRKLDVINFEIRNDFVRGGGRRGGGMDFLRPVENII